MEEKQESHLLRVQTQCMDEIHTVQSLLLPLLLRFRLWMRRMAFLIRSQSYRMHLGKDEENAN